MVRTPEQRAALLLSRNRRSTTITVTAAGVPHTVRGFCWEHDDLLQVEGRRSPHSAGVQTIWEVAIADLPAPVIGMDRVTVPGQPSFPIKDCQDTGEERWRIFL